MYTFHQNEEEHVYSARDSFFFLFFKLINFYYHHYELGVWYTWRVFCWIKLQRQRVSLAELDEGRDCWPHVTKLRTRTDAPSASSPFFWFWVPSNLELLLSSVVTAGRCYGQEEDRGMGYTWAGNAWPGLGFTDMIVFVTGPILIWYRPRNEPKTKKISPVENYMI